MKTERIEFVAPPGLKMMLQQEAAKANVSVGELIRRQFERDEDEVELEKLTAELKKQTAEAREALSRAVEGVDELVAELKSRRVKAEREVA